MSMGRPTLTEEKCPICGKIFCVGDREEWAYKYPGRSKPRLCCSWHCLRSKEQKRDGRVKGRKPNEMAQKIIDLLNKGKSLTETSKELGLPITTIRYWSMRR